MRTKLAVGAISTVLIAAAAWAGWNDTSTGIDLKSLPAFPLMKVRSGLLGNNARVQFDGLVAGMSGPADGPAVDEVVLSGTGKSGKGWAVHFSLVAFDEVYRGDLDGNGTQDYFIVGRTPFCCGRLLPPWVMAVLLMDKQGLPVPFEAQLYDDLGPRHILDLRHDGRAELALGVYDENPWDNRSEFGCSGHWVTSLYEEASLFWGEFQGSAAELTFPFVRRWDLGPDCNPRRSQQPWKDGFGHGESATASADVGSARIVEALGAHSVKLAPSGCPYFRIATIVYDQANRREIALAANSDYPDDLLNRIRRDSADITVRGVYRDPEGRFCSANMLWAKR